MKGRPVHASLVTFQDVLDQCIVAACTRSWDMSHIAGTLNRNNCSGFVHSVAAELGVPVVPFVMEYSDPKMAWVDDDTFVTHLLKMLTRPGWQVNLFIGKPLYGSDGEVLKNQVYNWMLERVQN